MKSSDERKHLSLMPTREKSEASIYGAAFALFADQVTLLKEHAFVLYTEALRRGIDPADMDAEYSLIELDLAEIANVTTVDGLPKVNYLNPEADRVKMILTGEGACTCDE